ncbi:MAG: prepilin peptidase [Candidatus Bathyarchaeota archaeon]|nr:prepilin peptidase [Candidatus Bathyarchaeota archaeon]
MEELLSWTRIIISLIFLAYASWSDFKTREVSNNVWTVFAPVAFLLTFAQFLFFPPFIDTLQSMINYGVSFAITSIFSIALFYVGAFGGADAKALICIALAMPLPLDFVEPLSGFVSFIFPITVFSNGVIIAALSVFYALLRNLLWRQRTGQKLFEGYENESFGRKTLALLCGYKVSVADLEGSFLYPLEDYQTTQQGEMKRRLLLFPNDENREKIVQRIIKAKSEGKTQNTIWATPGLPMLIFITIGLILALTMGDIVWIVLGRILR